MKSVTFVILFAFIHHAHSYGNPGFERDPETVKDCMEWYDNDGSRSCATIFSWFDLTAEIFHAWNPSVDLNCEPFRAGQSYCVLTETKYNQTHPTHTASSTPTATSTKSAASLGPSPTSWIDRGCYVENVAPRSSVLEQNMNPNGDASLSIPKCKQSCYRRAYKFSGVQQGDQCWCSNSVVGELSKDKSNCSTPCTGDKSSMCGGPGFLNVFEALKNQAVTGTSSLDVSSTVSKDAIITSSATSGSATKNAVWLL